MPFGLDPTSDAWPPVTLQDTGAALVVRADVPGLDPKSLDLNVDENTITLKGEREDKAPDGYTTHRKERTAYKFTRSFALPAKVDAEKVEAEIKNGVLTVTLPKAKEAQPRQINVRAS
jgi:HSP20 family protein